MTFSRFCLVWVVGIFWLRTTRLKLMVSDTENDKDPSKDLP